MARRTANALEIPSRDRLKSVLLEEEGPFLSLYMPVHHAGADAKKNPIRFKNLLREAREKLEALGNEHTDDLLDPLAALDDRDFWKVALGGLALFRCGGGLSAFALPFRVEECVEVSRRGFHARPLVPLLDGDGNRFYVLALSQHDVRLVECSPSSAREIEIPRAPHGLEDALRHDDTQKIDHFYPGSQGRSRGGITALAGHGVGPGDDKHEPHDEILRYFRQVDAALHDILKDERVPLVLAGVEYLHPIYREANTYPHLAEEALAGNPDAMRPDALREKAAAILAPRFRKPHEQAAEQYRQLAGSGRATNDLGQILPAAYGGRVAVLFADPRADVRGFFEAQASRLEISKDSKKGSTEGEDLLNLAIVQTVVNHGSVLGMGPGAVLEGVGPVAAVFRY